MSQGGSFAVRRARLRDMHSGETSNCPRCDAPRVEAPDCPRCGVIYARARFRAPRREPRLTRSSSTAAHAEEIFLDAAQQDARLEVAVRTWALPAVLFMAWLAQLSPLLRFFSRTFLSMWVHELGHAVTAWLCGFAAFPGPWVTQVVENRSPLLSLLFASWISFAAFRLWRSGRRGWAFACGALLALQAFGTWALEPRKAQALVTFGGDGGQFVLGSLLMATVYLPKEGYVRKGWLHWGFLVIGAFAFTDGLHTWWAARTDVGAIPFGRNEGVGLSDASRLVEEYGWTVRQLVGRYVALAISCLAILSCLYVMALARARRMLRSLN